MFSGCSSLSDGRMENGEMKGLWLNDSFKLDRGRDYDGDIVTVEAKGMFDGTGLSEEFKSEYMGRKDPDKGSIVVDPGQLEIDDSWLSTVNEKYGKPYPIDRYNDCVATLEWVDPALKTE